MKYSLLIITQINVITWISMVYTSTVVTSNNTDQSVLKSLIDDNNGAKGQLISKCPYEKSVLSKIPTKNFPRFLP